MERIEAIRRAKALIEHFSCLEGWSVVLMPEFPEPYSEKGGFCSDATRTIFLAEKCLHDDANARRLIQHEVAHALTPDDWHHGEEWKLAVGDLWRDPTLASIWQ
jgi:hypothetical protein